MDKTDTVKNLLIAAGVFLLVIVLGSKFFPTPTGGPLGHQDASTDVRTPGQETSGEAPFPTDGTYPNRGSRDVSQVSADQAHKPSNIGGFTIEEADEEQTLAMGAADLTAGGDEAALASPTQKDWKNLPYRMRLVLSNVGASIESATMTDHAQEVGHPARFQLLSLIETNDGRRFRSLPIEKITVDDVEIPLLDRKWHLGEVNETSDGQSVDFWLMIQQDGTDALKLTRTFALPRQPAESGRHDLSSVLTVENLSATPHSVIVTSRGALGITGVNPRFDDRVLDFAIRDSGGRVTGSRQQLADVSKKQVVALYPPEKAGESGRFLWAATENVYFTCTIAPLNADGSDGAGYIGNVTGIDVDRDAFTDNDATLQFVTREAVVQPDAKLTYQAAVYLGAKDARTFRSETDYSTRNYYYQIAQGFGWCTFTFLVELMVWLLNGLFFMVHDYGVAIIIMVLIVRTLLHPITKKGQVNMVRMQQRMGELAPKIEEIKKKYANDKARLNQEMMKLNINPAGQIVTCLPMILQMPIWIALYLSLQNNIQMRHQPIHYTWVTDLSAQDALYTFSVPLTVPIFGWQIASLNLLPILVAVFMYTQQKLQPKPKPNPNATDQQRQQQEMMQKMAPMMSIMMLLIFYNMPAGLNLYIMSSSLFGTIEQWYIRKHIKQREADGTLHKKPRSEERAGPGPGGNSPRGPRKASFLERMQKMAEEAQKGRGTAKAKPRR